MSFVSLIRGYICVDVDSFTFPYCFQVLMIGGKNDLMVVYPLPSEQKMVGRLKVDHMELVCRSYQPYHQIKVYKNHGVSVVTSEA